MDGTSGILALFADAEQALLASIALQKEVRRYNTEMENRGMDPIKVGIGLHTGILMERYFRHAAELMVKGVEPDWTRVEIMIEK